MGRCGKVLCSGGVGHSTQMLLQQLKEESLCKGKEICSEAEILGQVALLSGVEEQDLLLECHSTNTGANAQLSLQVLQKQNIDIQRILLIQDPLLQLRSYSTLKKVLPSSSTFFSYAPFIPRISDALCVTNAGNIWGCWDTDRFIELVIGEIPRIRDDKNGYGPNGKGYQIHMDIPDEVEAAHAVVCKAFPMYAGRLLL